MSLTNIPVFFYILLVSAYLSYAVMKAYYASSTITLNMGMVSVLIAVGVVILAARNIN